MTAFSNPVELVDPYPETDTWMSGGIARADIDIAVVAWISGADAEGLNGTQPLHIAAVRYTSTGPEIGPVLTLDEIYAVDVNDVVRGRDGEAWVVAEDHGLNRLLIGQALVDPATLIVTLTWTASLPIGWNYDGVVADSWWEEALLVVAHNNGHPSLPDDSFVYLISMDTGAIVATKIPPLYDPNFTSLIVVLGTSLHKESGKLLIFGSFYDRGASNRTRSGIWSIDVTPAGFASEWTRVATLPPPSPTSNHGYRWVAAAAVSNGWHILYMSANQTGFVRWYRLGLDWVLTEGLSPAGNASSYYNGGFPKVYDCKYDEALDRSVAAYMDWGGVRGLIFQESEPGSLLFLEQRLPKSNSSMNDASMSRIAVVGPGRYVYFGACTGILRPRGPNAEDSFGPMVWVGGPDVTIPEAGLQDGATRGSFRRVN